MTTLQIATLVATALMSFGLFLLLPRGAARGRRVGGLLTTLAIGLFAGLGALAARIPWLGPTAESSIFVMLAAVSLTAAVCTISFRNPVYSAIWFALTLLGTSGLFLFQGAQFLAAATVVVYAGAILVTFLFVLMLANPKGRAYYDRVTWEPLVASAVGAVLVGILSITLAAVYLVPVDEAAPAAPHSTEQLATQVLAADHMARLGKELFSRHLIAVEVAGTLLLVALVGAVAVLSHEVPGRPARAADAGGTRG